MRERNLCKVRGQKSDTFFSIYGRFSPTEDTKEKRSTQELWPVIRDVSTFFRSCDHPRQKSHLLQQKSTFFPSHGNQFHFSIFFYCLVRCILVSARGQISFSYLFVFKGKQRFCRLSNKKRSKHTPTFFSVIKLVSPSRFAT